MGGMQIILSEKWAALYKEVFKLGIYDKIGDFDELSRREYRDTLERERLENKRKVYEHIFALHCEGYSYIDVYRWTITLDACKWISFFIR